MNGYKLYDACMVIRDYARASTMNCLRRREWILGVGNEARSHPYNLSTYTEVGTKLTRQFLDCRPMWGDIVVAYFLLGTALVCQLYLLHCFETTSGATSWPHIFLRTA